MIELLKNKVMFSFIVLILVVVYIDSVNTKKLEEIDNQEPKDQLTLNIER